MADDFAFLMDHFAFLMDHCEGEVFFAWMQELASAEVPAAYDTQSRALGLGFLVSMPRRGECQYLVADLLTQSTKNNWLRIVFPAPAAFAQGDTAPLYAMYAITDLGRALLDEWHAWSASGRKPGDNGGKGIGDGE